LKGWTLLDNQRLQERWRHEFREFSGPGLISGRFSGSGSRARNSDEAWDELFRISWYVGLQEMRCMGCIWEQEGRWCHAFKGICTGAVGALESVGREGASFLWFLVRDLINGFSPAPSDAVSPIHNPYRRAITPGRH
jgi:hypothetical protein